MTSRDMFAPSSGDLSLSVQYCFEGRLRQPLAYALDQRQAPIDALYLPDCKSTLLERAIALLSEPPTGAVLSMPRYRGDPKLYYETRAPYIGIALDLLARGASPGLMPQDGGDFAYDSAADALRGTELDNHLPSALLRYWEGCEKSRFQLFDYALLDALIDADDWGFRRLAYRLSTDPQGRPDVYRHLLARGLDLNSPLGKETPGTTVPLVDAMQKGDIEAVRTLLKLGARVSDTFIWSLPRTSHAHSMHRFRRHTWPPRCGNTPIPADAPTLEPLSTFMLYTYADDPSIVSLVRAAKMRDGVRDAVALAGEPPRLQARRRGLSL